MRYEGMDELLGRIRERLAVPRGPESPKGLEGVPGGRAAGRHPSSTDLMIDGNYEAALNRMLIVLHDAEELRGIVSRPEVRRLPPDQLDDLLALLDNIRLELRRSEQALQH